MCTGRGYSLPYAEVFMTSRLRSTLRLSLNYWIEVTTDLVPGVVKFDNKLVLFRTLTEESVSTELYHAEGDQCVLVSLLRFSA